MTVETHRNCHRVTKSRPCPICERPDWCGVIGNLENPDLAICMRVSEGAKRESRNGGWIHVLRSDQSTPRSRSRRSSITIRNSGVSFDEVLDGWRRRTTRSELDDCAAKLGIDVRGLDQLGVCRAERRDLGALNTKCSSAYAWAFAMRDGHGDIVGIRLRTDGGFKWAIKGSQEGIFLPCDLDENGLLAIVEGPTDAAAMLGLGIPTIGRPSCIGGVRQIRRLLHGRRQRVAVFADRDGPGQRGALRLARALRAVAADVAIKAPPRGFKDVRDWVRHGAAKSDVLELAASASDSVDLHIPSNFRSQAVLT